MNCPTCGKDDQVRSVRAIYQSGTQEGQQWSRSYGVAGFGGDTVPLMGGSYGSSQSQSLLAQRLGPPEDPNPGNWFWRITIAICLTLLALWDFFILPDHLWPIPAFLALLFWGSSVILLYGMRIGREGYRRGLRRWSQLSYCYRCDRVF